MKAILDHNLRIHRYYDNMVEPGRTISFLSVMALALFIPPFILSPWGVSLFTGCFLAVAGISRFAYFKRNKSKRF